MEYMIVAKISTLGHPMSNVILEWIHQVLGNLVRTCNINQTYADKDYPWSGILDTVEFAIFSTTNRLKGYSLGQLLFGRDKIPPIKHTVDWELICQQKQTQINKDNIRKNRNRVDHDYNVRDKFMITNHAA